MPGVATSSDLFRPIHQRVGDQGLPKCRHWCLDSKKPVIDAITAELEPIHTEAEQFENDRDLVRSILLEGGEKARESARETLAEVRSAIGLSAWQ